MIIKTWYIDYLKIDFDADAQYFDHIPSIIQYQNLRFKVVSKEQKRLQLIDENEEHQTIIVESSSDLKAYQSKLDRDSR